MTIWHILLLFCYARTAVYNKVESADSYRHSSLPHAEHACLATTAPYISVFSLDVGRHFGVQSTHLIGVLIAHIKHAIFYIDLFFVVFFAHLKALICINSSIFHIVCFLCFNLVFTWDFRFGSIFMFVIDFIKFYINYL